MTSQPIRSQQALRHEARVYFSLSASCRHLALLADIIPATESDGALLVMEWADGGTVHDWLRREPNALLHLRLRLAIQACRGLQELHERDMVSGSEAGERAPLRRRERRRRARGQARRLWAVLGPRPRRRR